MSSAFAGDGAGYDAGIAAAQDIFITLDNINRIVPQDKITTACYLYDLESSAVTGDMFGSTILSYAGVTNVFDSLSGGVYDFETLEIANPNLIFCAPGLKEQIESDSRFADFQAVQQDKVVEMDPSLMSWQGRTVVEAAYEISAAAYPELLEESSPEVDPASEIDSQVSSALEEEEQLAQYGTLEEGNTGDQVLAMQERLAELGYLTAEYDGHYGATTADCVSRFQSANGLEATGIADPATQLALFKEGALREDGTPLPEETGESSSSTAGESSSSSSGEDAGASESSSQPESSSSSSSEGSSSSSGSESSASA